MNADDEHQMARLERELVQRRESLVVCSYERERVDFATFHSLTLVATPSLAMFPIISGHQRSSAVSTELSRHT